MRDGGLSALMDMIASFVAKRLSTRRRRTCRLHAKAEPVHPPLARRVDVLLRLSGAVNLPKFSSPMLFTTLPAREYMRILRIL